MSAVCWCKMCLLWCAALPPALFCVRDSTGTCGTRAFALRLSPRYARPWFRSGVIGGGSTGVLCSVVAFATIRPRRVRRGRLWRCVDDCLFVCALLRGRWVAGELSYGVRSLQRQRKRHQHDPSGFRTPASAPYGSPSARGYLRKRPSGRSIARRAAPFGASCDESPRIRPHLVVAPKGAARRRFGFAFAFPQRLYFPLPRAQERVRCSSQLGG